MIKTERLNGPNPDVDFDETLEEFRFKKDAVLTKTSHKELAVGNINSSTGQVESNFDVANDGTTTLQGFEWTYDSNNEELVFSDPDGIELMRHPKAGSTQFLQGIDVAYPFETPEDSLTNFVNSPNTTATSSGDTVGYNFSVNNQTVAQVSADSDGSGGIGDGKFVVRQAGGTAGTDEVQIYHDGTDGHIVSKENDLHLSASGNKWILVSNGNFVPDSDDSFDIGGVNNKIANFYIGGDIRDSNDNELLSFTSTSAAVNEIDIANAATGNAPTISAVGDDADISISLAPKGAGAVNFASNHTADTSGDLQIRDDSGGDLFSLDDGSFSPILAKYEGSGAFTLGDRDGSIGNNSFAFGESVEASGQYSISLGNFTDATGDWSVALGRSSQSTAAQSIAAGFGSQASANSSVAMGDNANASGSGSIALGVTTSASGAQAVALGDNTAASKSHSMSTNFNTAATARSSISIGFYTLSRVFGGSVLGVYNEDNVGLGNEVKFLKDLSSNSKIFAVGAGDDSSAVSGDNNYFDGRGRVDGLYVTMRDGTHIRHGLTVDRYNSGTSSYQKSAEITEPGSLILSGAVTKGTANRVSSDYTTTSTDYFVGIDTTTGSHTITIRSTDIEDGREIVVHDQGGNASGNNITIQTEGSETISGAQYGSDLSSITLNTDNESVALRGAIDNRNTGETNLYVV